MLVMKYALCVLKSINSLFLEKIYQATNKLDFFNVISHYNDLVPRTAWEISERSKFTPLVFEYPMFFLQGRGLRKFGSHHNLSITCKILQLYVPFSEKAFKLVTWISYLKVHTFNFNLKSRVLKNIKFYYFWFYFRFVLFLTMFFTKNI